MNKKVLPRILTLLFVLGLLVSVGAVMAANIPQASLQTITVDTTVDELIDNGNCSLREAVQAANEGTAVDNCPAGGITTTIMIPAGTYSLTIPLDFDDDYHTGDLDILTSVIIKGAGADVTILDANKLDRVFFISDEGNAEISDVTITGGNAGLDPDGEGRDGGGIWVYEGRLYLHDAIVKGNEAHKGATLGGLGGGIMGNGAEIIVKDVEISGNDAAATGGGLHVRDGIGIVENSHIVENNSGNVGGGISHQAINTSSSMSVAHSTVVSNTAAFNGGGLSNAFSTALTATLSLDHVVVDGNSAFIGTDYLRGLGGGIANALHIGTSSGKGILNISNSTISNNSATNGGGIGSTPATATGYVQMEVMIDNSAIIGNVANGTGAQVGNGGGILNLDGSLTVRNSTIARNQATGTGSALSGLGGGIFAGSQAFPNSVSLAATTISENTAALAGDGVTNANMGGSTAIQFKNTLVAENGVMNCLNNGGTMTSLGFNWDSQNVCGFNQITDWVDSDPMLGDLTEMNGTAIYPLLAGSGAIDNGSCTDHNDNPIATDQRGMSRPQGTVCDIGAYEASSDLTLTHEMTLPGDINAVPYGAVVTYTLTLSNSGVITAVNAMLTDTLPLELDFVDWVAQPSGSAVLADEITWTGDLPVGEAVTVAFSAVHVGDYGDKVANTVLFSDTAGSGADTHTFTVVPRYYVYLPMVTK